MKNDEINRTIKECFKSLDYRDNEIAKLNRQKHRNTRKY